MAFFRTLTQGGQVHIHQLHMFKQVFVAGIIVAFVIGASCFAWKSYQLPGYGWRVLSQTSWARFMITTNPVQKHPELYQDYVPLKGKPYRRSCLSILKDPFLKKTTLQMETILKEIATKSLEWAGLSFLALMGLWFFLGRGHKQAQHQRGNTFMEFSKLAALLRRKGEASDLNLGKLPLIKDKETSHLLMTGTTGSGKTNAFHILLPQIRQRGDKAIIVDVTGTYISQYYNPETDFILNPLDVRSQYWHPWADCHLESHYDVLADSFIPENKQAKDPFWDNASRAVLKAALRKYASQETPDIDKLATFLLSSEGKEFEAFFKGTDAANFTCDNNEKTTQSIRSVLSSYIEGLRQLENTGTSRMSPFSLRSWVMNEKQKGTIFITARADQRQTLKPLISAWVDMAINALMVLPEDYTRRLWFVIDELAALQKLPSLQMGLAEGRKYGGCFLVGFQSKPQLEEIYGRQGAESMLDLFNTKVFFRCTEPSTQTWISKVLGDKEEIEPQENISYGANSMRDGVSLSHHTRQKPLVMPTELSQLKDLECYIKLPGDYPCSKFQMTYQTPSGPGAPAFLLKPEKKRTYETVPVVQKKKVVKETKKKPLKQETIVISEDSDEEENEKLA
ncbi:MAG: type IV conjugative transfer system coupling protein TraD [Alphaproteobacteria bacterium]|nr:type IV conjugative transfer system coupling protein TraD [Alphaproteobacteria bacterium]